jgi:hypothetical protein
MCLVRLYLVHTPKVRDWNVIIYILCDKLYLNVYTTMVLTYTSSNHGIRYKLILVRMQNG